MIGLAGYYGYGNYGDELFLATWRQKLGYNNTVVVRPDDDITGIDDIIIGGGDLLWNYGINNNYFFDGWLAKNLYIYGIGVPVSTKDGLPENDKLWYQRFIDTAKYVSVRDKYSQEWVKDVVGRDTQVVGDIAWSYKPTVKRAKDEKTVGLSYRRNPWFTTDDMAKMCLQIADRKTTIRFIPLQDNYQNTRALNKIIMEETRRCIDYPPLNLTAENLDADHKYANIASLNYYITSAFHGVITALRERVPVICLCSANKFDQLLVSAGMFNSIVCIDPAKLKDKVDYLFSPDYKFHPRIDTIEKQAQADLDSFIEKYFKSEGKI